MPYTKTTWTDRVVAKPMTFTFQSNGDGTTTLVPSEGTITSVGTSITAVTMNNLESQYDKAMTDVALTYVKLTGNQTVTGDLTLSSGADTSPLTLINDNGQLLFVNDATENSLQSLIGNGSASRPFTIEGLNGANISNFNVRADNSNFFGNISITRASQNLILKGTAVGNSNNAYLELQDSGGTRAGFFGKTSSASATIGVWSDIGDIVVRGTTNVMLNVVGATVLSAVSTGVAVTGTLSSTGTLSVNNTTTGSTLMALKNSTDDGYIRVVTTATNNFIQSGNNAFTSSKNLQITGYNGNTLPLLSLYADNTFLSGTLTINQGGTTSNLGSAAFTHLLLKKATFKSWTLQHSASGDLVYYPSATADLQDWVTANAFSFVTDGTFNARVLKENGTLLSAKYSPIASPTFTGTVTAPTINATGNLQENGTNLSSKYLALTGGTVVGQITMQGDIIGTGYTVDVSSLREDGVRVNQTYAKLSGATFTGLVSGTTINATTLQEGGTALTSKYAQIGVNNNFTVAQTITSGGLTLNEGTLSSGSATNDGRIRTAFTSTINYIQSGLNSGGSTVKNLTISGFGATILNEINLACNTLKIAGQPLQSGMVTITPVANTPTKVTVVFPTPYTSPPHVTVTAESGVIGSQVMGASVANITSTQCDIYVYRTNTNSTNVHWIAMI